MTSRGTHVLDKLRPLSNKGVKAPAIKRIADQYYLFDETALGQIILKLKARSTLGAE